MYLDILHSLYRSDADEAAKLGMSSSSLEESKQTNETKMDV